MFRKIKHIHAIDVILFIQSFWMRLQKLVHDFVKLASSPLYA